MSGGRLAGQPKVDSVVDRTELSRCDWVGERQLCADTNNPIDGDKTNSVRVGVMLLRADSNAWWCAVCRSSSTRVLECFMALTAMLALRAAAILCRVRCVDGGRDFGWSCRG